jgi:type II secretory pathway component PulF
MPEFDYWATTEIGDTVTGRLTASSPDAAAHLLAVRGLVVQRLEEVPAASPAAPGPVSLTEADFGPLASSLESRPAAKLPLITSLRALAEESRSFRFRRSVFRMIAALERGQPVDEVLRKFSATFPRRLSALADAGVTTGRLPFVMQHALDDLRRAAELRRRVWSNLSYPAVLMLVAGVILGGIFVMIVPTFKRIFDDFGTDLPGLTKAVVAFSDASVNVVWGVVDWEAWLGWKGALLALMIAVAAFVGTGFLVGNCDLGVGVRRLSQRCLHRTPLLGSSFRAASLSGFFRLLALLTEAGLALPAALRLAGEVNGDADLSAGAERIADGLERGASPVDAVRDAETLPREVLPIFRWTDQRSLFIEALRGAADIFAARSQLHSGITVVVLEPMLIFGVGMTVGLVVLALFMPLLKLLNDLA